MRTLLLAVCLLVASTSFAQLPINVGLKAGANYSLLQSDADGITTNGKPSFSAGAFGRFKVKKFSAQIEALYVNTGGTFEQGPIEQDVKYANLDIPLLVGYKFLDLKVLKMRVNAGVTQSIVISKDADDFIIEDGYEDGYTSGTIGVSADIPLFVFDLRYQHAFGDYYAINDFESQNNMITLSVGWKIL